VEDELSQLTQRLAAAVWRAAAFGQAELPGERAGDSARLAAEESAKAIRLRIEEIGSIDIKRINAALKMKGAFPRIHPSS
jgi:hypothetical protein